MKQRIVFQGDSVTDAGRNKENEYDLGKGYPFMVACALESEYADKYEFINKGISGNKVVDLLARNKRDVINLKPDVLSIMVGVNDIWHELDFNTGVSASLYEGAYNLLVEDIRRNLPDTKIMIMGSYILKNEKILKYYDKLKSGVEERAEIARKIAQRNNIPFVSLQEKFDRAIKEEPSEHWLVDGVHPTSFGHKLIANEWMNLFKTL